MSPRGGLLLLLLWAAGGRGGDAPQNPVVRTEPGGLVRGAAGDGACVGFYGIPFAAARRFGPPSPAAPWAGVRDGTRNEHPVCMQQPDSGAFGIRAGWVERLEELALDPAGYMSEDCLTVDVQSPNLTARNPVLLYIYGGSYLAGTGDSNNASAICADGVVYIAFNYRVGVFGAMALPEMLNESGTAGNWAIQDQRAAMQWVQNNAARFGGDPSRVTIMGESAGAMAVYAHTALPRSHGLFAQSIAMSGNDFSMSLTEAFAAGEQFADQLGCARGPGRMRCLRALPAVRLLNLQTSVYNQSMRALQVPVADGFELPVNSSLKEFFSKGLAQPLPMLLGHNSDDISMFLAFTLPELLPNLAGLPAISQTAMELALRRLFPAASLAERLALLGLYSPQHFNRSAAKAFYALTTDAYFGCPTLRVARAQPDRRYRYLFDAVLHDPVTAFGLNYSWVPRWITRLVTAKLERWLGAFHGSNSFVFWGTDGLSATEQALGQRMRSHWLNFIATGRPRENWPVTSEAERALMLRLEEDTVVSEQHRLRCLLIDSLKFSWNPPTLSGLPSVIP